MKRLPNVDQVCAQVLSRVDELEAETLEKEASERPAKVHTVPLAQLMAKFAEQLRSIDPNAVSMQDVREFQKQVMEHKNGTG